MLISSPFATADDLAARWRTLTIPEQTLATTLLEDASNLILSECSSANVVDDDDTTEQTIRTATLKRVVCAIVKRAMMDTTTGPSILEHQQNAGPFGDRVKYANPTGDLFLKKSEYHSLPCGRQVAFTIPMEYIEDEDDLS
ncbi:MAG: phage Gp19/Gp15/Gp42 family protein [Sphaerochaeta sp.]|jgi:hypothetical protein|nr:phage Gp19/Gp15/Gp42 family protein [Sphaerochaeta sp.]